MLLSGLRTWRRLIRSRIARDSSRRRSRLSSTHNIALYRFETLEDRMLRSATYSSDPSPDLTIPGNGQLDATISVGASVSINDINVTLDISHTSDQDLDVFLISPDGTRVELFTDVGGGGDNFSSTTLDDEAAGSGGLDTPRQLIFGPDGSFVEGEIGTGDEIEDLYVVSAKTDSILRYDGVTGAFQRAFVAANSGGLNEPTAITFGPNGNFYVASGAHEDFFNSILRYDSNGNFLDVFVPAGTAGLTLAPTAGMIFGPDVNSDSTQDLYVSNGEVDEVLIYNGIDGTFLETFITSGLGGLDDPKGLLFDTDGNLLVVNNGDHSVRRFGAASQAVFTVSLSSPSATEVTVDFDAEITAGSAVSGSDYTATSGTLTFAPGETTKTIVVPTLDDGNIEQDETFTAELSNPVDATINDGSGSAVVVDDDSSNDLLFGSQWNLNNVGQTGGTVDADLDAVEAWNITTGSLSTVVAIIDRGGAAEYFHEDLYLNIWINEGEIPSSLTGSLIDTDADGIITFYDLNDPVNAAWTFDFNGTGYNDAGDLLADPVWENGIDEDANGYFDDLIGWNFEENDNDPYDPTRSHATKQAGELGVIGNNGVGLTGVNWRVRMMSLRNPLLQLPESGIDSLNYAVAQGATISSNSWGYYSYSQQMYDAIQAAGEAGHLFIAAAGKGGTDNDIAPFYAASYDLNNIISVTGTDHNDIYGPLVNQSVLSVD